MLRIASLILWLVAWIPAPLRNAKAWLLAWLIQHGIRYRRKVVRTNLLNAFPDKSLHDIKIIETKFYRQFTRLLLEINAGRVLTNSEMASKIKYKNPELLEQYLTKGQSVILVFGHYGNWEWTVGLPLILNHPVLAIYHPLTNPRMDKVMQKIRSRFGLIPVPMKSIYKELVNRAKADEAVVTFFIADQSPNRSQIKQYFPFLNQPTGVFQGTERIAAKLGQAVVYMKMNLLQPGYYEAEFFPLVENAALCSENEITTKHLKMLEDNIIQRPELWLWTHKRWKHKPLAGESTPKTSA